MSVAMATPAFAGAQVYASLRYDTFYVYQKATTNNVAGDDNATTLQNQGAVNSRFGAKFSEGNLTGQYEVGVKDASGGNALYTRLMYGTYKFNGGSLLFGQTYNPWTMFSDQVYDGDNGNIGFGALYDSRQPQVKLTLDSGFYLTLVTTKVSKVNSADVGYAEIPKIGIGYNGKAGNTTFGGGFAYNTFKEKNDATGIDDNLNSYIIFARASVDVAPVTVKFQGHYGQNLGNFGISGRQHAYATLNSSGTGFDNTDGWGGFVQVGAKVAPTASVNVGAGYVRDKQADTKYNQTTVFVNAPIEIAPHFHVVPEFDYFHYAKKNGVASTGSHIGVPDAGMSDLKDAYVFGAKWQMDF
jgi:hypothetical protein